MRLLRFIGCAVVLCFALAALTCGLLWNKVTGRDVDWRFKS